MSAFGRQPNGGSPPVADITKAKLIKFRPSIGTALRGDGGYLQLKPIAEVAFLFPQSAFRGRKTVGASPRRSQFLPASIR